MMLFGKQNKKLDRRVAAARGAQIRAAVHPCLEGLEDRRLFATVPVSGGVPLLSSNPSATAKLYLDFDGDAASAFGSLTVSATPAFDTDGNATTFSDDELGKIREIWARVAEKFSPFNIDVSTVDPGTFTDRRALKVVVGGDGAWTGKSYGGFSASGSFYDPAWVNTAFVFTRNLSSEKFIGEEVARHAGRSFGLEWQSLYGAEGYLLTRYNGGTSAVAPVMGSSYYSTRGTWWYGTSSNYWIGSDGRFIHQMQDDMAVLAGSNNGFGYRADDHGNGTSAATALSGSETVTRSGIIEKTTDADYFSFTTGGGQVIINAAVAQFGATLDLKLSVMNASGSVVASADTLSLGEALTLNLAAGTYYIGITGHGMIPSVGSTGLNQGSAADVGQYTLTVTGPTGAATAPDAPSGFTATSFSSSQINLSWLDNSGNETGFVVDRSTDSTFSQNVSSVSVGANVTAYSATGLTSGTMYYFRVRAINTAGASTNSNTAGAATYTIVTAPLAPSGLTASTVSAGQINLSWADNSANETGFVIERATDNGFTQNVIAMTLGTNVTAYSATGLASGTTYYFRVRALNSAGASANSNTASATTQTLVTVPVAPSALTASAVSSSQINLAWTDNASNETGFKIERSLDGANWSQIATTGAGVTTWQNTGLSAATTYRYRVCAFNSAGDSGLSPIAMATTMSPAVTAPAAPASATATAMSSSRIDISWANVTGESGYKIERSTDGTNWSHIATTAADVTTFANAGLSASTTYRYRICAYNAGGDSGVSPVATATTLAPTVTVPAAPAGLTATAVSSSRINLTWADNANNETGFTVERSTNSTFSSNRVTIAVGANVTSYSATGLTAGTRYYFRVRASNSAGSSANSNTANASTQASESASLLQNLSGGSKMDVKDGQKGAQSFRYGTAGTTYTVTNLTLRVSREQDAPNGDFVVSIGTGINSGALAGSTVRIDPKVITNTSGGSTFQTLTIVFASPITLNGNQTYYLNLEAQSTNGKVIYLEYASSNTYANGTYFKQGSDDSKDLWFQFGL